VKARRIPDSSHSLAPPLVFGIFTLAGVAFIVAAKLLEQNPFVVTFTPVLLMLGYAAMILLARPLRLRDDQTGDNFYYMGFIFTLTSLGVSLYQFTGDASVAEIVRNFGIAVASTITGIALRIFFTQLRRDPVEVEAVARYELADASRRVRRELDGMLMEMAHFRRTNQQMLEEGFEEIRGQVQHATTNHLSVMSTLADEALSHIRRSDGALGEAIASNGVTAQLAETAKTIAEVNAAMKTAAEQMATSAGSFAAQLKAALPSVPVAADTAVLQLLADRVALLSGQQANLLAASERLVAAVERLEGRRPELRLWPRLAGWLTGHAPAPEAAKPAARTDSAVTEGGSDQTA
jgi:hypothetical protein